ncbi:hypothetical protein H4582DRAFT_2051275 [Lactarius indigo]|nr:hypothetical protein H4582DRAFT_2051275 [Lactarius indigo]
MWKLLYNQRFHWKSSSCNLDEIAKADAVIFAKGTLKIRSPGLQVISIYSLETTFVTTESVIKYHISTNVFNMFSQQSALGLPVYNPILRMRQHKWRAACAAVLRKGLPLLADANPFARPRIIIAAAQSDLIIIDFDQPSNLNTALAMSQVAGLTTCTPGRKRTQTPLSNLVCDRDPSRAAVPSTIPWVVAHLGLGIVTFAQRCNETVTAAEAPAAKQSEIHVVGWSHFPVSTLKRVDAALNKRPKQPDLRTLSGLRRWGWPVGCVERLLGYF